MTYKNHKLTWKKDFGDGELTDDIVLWIDGNPSQIVISGAIEGWYGVLMYGDKELYTANTRKELKEVLFSEFSKYVDKEVELYSEN